MAIGTVTGTDARLVIVGDGGEAAILRQQAERAGLRNRVIFAGRIDRDSETADIVRASDLVLLPSYSESLPAPLIEAAACARPVIATDVGGAREVVIDGVTGVLIPPGEITGIAEAVIELLENPHRRAQMGQEALLEPAVISLSTPGQADCTRSIPRRYLVIERAMHLSQRHGTPPSTTWAERTYAGAMLGAPALMSLPVYLPRTPVQRPSCIAGSTRGSSWNGRPSCGPHRPGTITFGVGDGHLVRAEITTGPTRTNR